ncbi:MAG: hypothetical protein IPM83_07485 [Ignavibacteria bacterium]|nr:hypothetical protein [Ignavibacteria bacterium]
MTDHTAWYDASSSNEDMTARGILVLLLALCSVDITRAQLSIAVSPAVGVTSTSASFRQLGQLVLPAQAAGLSSSAGITTGINTGIIYPLSSWLHLYPRIGFTYSTLAFIADEPTTFVVDGEETDGIIEHTYGITGSSIELGGDARLRVFDRLWLVSGLDVSFPLGMNGTQDQTIAEPSNVTFIDGSTTIRTADSAIPGTRSAPYLSIGVMFPVSYNDLDIALEVLYRTALTSIVNSADIVPSAVIARVTLAFPFGSHRASTETLNNVMSAPEPVVGSRLFSSVTRDAILPMPRIPEVFATCSVGFRSVDGAVVRAGSVSLSHELALVTEQHAGGLAQRRLDTVTIADPPAMIITPVVRTDDEIASWTATIQLRDSLITIARGYGNVPESISWECSLLPSGLLSQLLRDSALVVVTAVGRRGAMTRSAPVVVRMESEPIVHLVDTTQFIASLTGFEPNQTSLPIWAESVINELEVRATRSSRIVVLGMADGVGERDANERIARDRAHSAEAALAPHTCTVKVAALPEATVHDDVRGKDRGVRIIVRQSSSGR